WNLFFEPWRLANWPTGELARKCVYTCTCGRVSVREMDRSLRLSIRANLLLPFWPTFQMASWPVGHVLSDRNLNLRQSRRAFELHRGGGGARDVAAGRE